MPAFPFDPLLDRINAQIDLPALPPLNDPPPAAFPDVETETQWLAAHLAAVTAADNTPPPRRAAPAPLWKRLLRRGTKSA
ncbi:hypothetical protein [Saccharothrix xinjiangensis]|uniref:Acyl-CoA carboxylase epsilon subunit-like protein n=1 Tax=Saccharothrix xinjiangensis TaxID=204798 RepID=A0ABV9XWR5_9PSEU